MRLRIRGAVALAGLTLSPWVAQVRAQAMSMMSVRSIDQVPAPEPTVTLHADSMPLDAVLRAISAQGGVRIGYSLSVVPVARAIKIHVDRVAPIEALQRALAGTGISISRMSDGSLLLFSAARERIVEVNGTIVGSVVEAGSRQPLAGAQIVVAGTTLGATTNDRGRFAIPNVPAGTYSLRLTRIGYRPESQAVTLQGNDTAHVDVALAVASVQLDQVVITGTVGTQTRRAQGAVVADVDVSTLTKTAPVVSLTDVLQSRIPGVSVQRADGTSGTGQTIRIRGAASISLSNDPLIFIDGIRADSRTTSPNANRGGGCAGCDVGGQATSRLNDIPPEDIESIEVVKGPAAATLYGADASAGVIQIITKRGRINSGSLQQSVTYEYNGIDANFSPPSNYATCTAANVANAASTLCYQKPVGTVVSDNPLLRDDVFRTGRRNALSWTGRGGGQNYGYYAAFSRDRELGTLPSNEVFRQTGRFNFHFQPAPSLIVDASFGTIWNNTQLPDQGNNPYGFQSALLGNPTTVGGVNDGWFAPFRNADAIAAIDSHVDNFRTTPVVDVKWSPVERFTNSLTVGADFSRTHTTRLVPRNDPGWFSAADNVGHINEGQQNRDNFTVSYLGNVRSGLFNASAWESAVSFGMQLTGIEATDVSAEGFGLASNVARSVSAAATRSGSQSEGTTRSVGFLGQWEVSRLNRLFVQLGARVDQANGFGENVKHFFLPKISGSWVVSEEPFFRENVGGWLSLLRARAAFGTTGRAPPPGAARATYTPCSYLNGAAISQGVCLANPGNPDLRPEKGTEVEAGIDVAVFDNRVGAELTYFRKTTTDLLLTRQLPPSLGYGSNPSANIGGVLNDGVELSLRAQPIARPGLTWDSRVSMNTLHNEVTSLGDLPLTPGGNAPGLPLSPWTGWRVRRIDLARGVAILSDSVEYVGNRLPRFEGSFFNDLSFARAVRFGAQLDWKSGYLVFNQTAQFREKSTPVAQNRIDTLALPREERLRRFGPYRTETKDSVVTSGVVNEPYYQDGKFLRLREVSVTLTVPERLAAKARLHGASITLAGRNLRLWKGDYEGPDPEVHSTAFAAFDQADFLQIPQARRFVVRLSFQP